MPGLKIWQGCEYSRVTQGAQYAWIMSQYEWICHNNAEYGWICRHMPEKTEFWIFQLFWMCLMQYIALDHCTTYCAVTETEKYSEHCQKFKIERFTKRIMPECRCTTKNFSGQDGESGDCGTEHLQKRSRKGSIFEAFSPRYSLNYILKDNLIQWWIQSGSFFPKSGYFFRFSKRAREGSPFVSNCVSGLLVWVHLHRYPWICLNIVENVWINCAD